MTDNRSLKTVATDSHKMSQKKITLEKNGDNFDVVIPSRSLREFTAVFTDEIETVEVFLFFLGLTVITLVSLSLVQSLQPSWRLHLVLY